MNQPRGRDAIAAVNRALFDSFKEIRPEAVSEVAGFDYSTLSPKVAQEVRDVAERIRERARAAVIDTGRDLLAIKKRMKHGQFLAWIGAEFSMTERTAQNYMRAASKLGTKSEIISYLPPTTLYTLSAPSTPAPVYEEVVKRIEAGERLAPAAVERIVRAARNEVQTARDEARAAARAAKITPEEKARLQAKEKQRQAQEERYRAEKEARREARREDERFSVIRRKAAQEAAAELIVRKIGGDLSKLILLLEAAESFIWREIAVAAGLNTNPLAEWRTEELEALVEEAILDAMPQQTNGSDSRAY